MQPALYCYACLQSARVTFEASYIYIYSQFPFRSVPSSPGKRTPEATCLLVRLLGSPWFKATSYSVKPSTPPPQPHTAYFTASPLMASRPVGEANQMLWYAFHSLVNLLAILTREFPGTRPSLGYSVNRPFLRHCPRVLAGILTFF